MKSLSPLAKGTEGEKYTAKFLKKQGFHIIKQNMRNRISEIDIIAENREYIIFVEVKTRSGESDFLPSLAVDKKKQRKLMLAAKAYLTDNNITKQPRFDVAEVYLDREKHKPYKINYIESAFMQGGSYAVL